MGLHVDPEPIIPDGPSDTVRSRKGAATLLQSRNQAVAMLARASNGRGARIGAMLRTADGDGDGRVTHEQMGRALRNRGLGIESRHARALAASVDRSGTGVVSISDIEDVIDAAGRDRDQDQGAVRAMGQGTTQIGGTPAAARRGASFENFRRALWERIPGQSLSRVLRTVDGNRDGQMDRPRFESCLRAMGVRVKPADLDVICDHPSVRRAHGRVGYVALANLASMHSGSEAAVESGRAGEPHSLGMTSSAVMRAASVTSARGVTSDDGGLPVRAAGGASGRLDISFGHASQPVPTPSKGLSDRVPGSVHRPFDSL